MIENICIFTSEVKYLKYFHDVLVFLSFDFTSENLKFEMLVLFVSSWQKLTYSMFWWDWSLS